MIKIKITSIGLEYDVNEPDDLPVIHYDLMKNGKKIGSSMKNFSISELKQIENILELSKLNIEKDLNI